MYIIALCLTSQLIWINPVGLIFCWFSKLSKNKIFSHFHPMWVNLTIPVKKCQKQHNTSTYLARTCTNVFISVIWTLIRECFAARHCPPRLYELLIMIITVQFWSVLSTRSNEGDSLINRCALVTLPVGGSNALCSFAHRADKTETEDVVVFSIDIFMYLWLLGSVFWLDI